MDIFRYRKFFIYILTFLAYAWSGYGAGLLSNLRDAVLATESIFEDFFQNAITVARKIKDIHEVFDAAVEESCVFKCPTGMTQNEFEFLLKIEAKLTPNLKIIFKFKKGAFFIPYAFFII